MNIINANNDLGIHKLLVKFLISLNSAKLLSATLKFKIETFIILLQNMHF